MFNRNVDMGAHNCFDKTWLRSIAASIACLIVAGKPCSSKTLIASAVAPPFEVTWALNTAKGISGLLIN